MESLGCSRRALLKRRKLCHQCKKKPATFTDAGMDGQELQFCSPTCLEQFKLDIFTQETFACLQSGKPQIPTENVTNNELSVRAEKVVSSPIRPRKRSVKTRPHPSYRLNKRYWDRIKINNSTVEAPEAKKPKITVEEATVEKEEPTPKEESNEKKENNQSSSNSVLVPVPIPIPFPIPVPFLVTDRFVKEQFLEVPLD